MMWQYAVKVLVSAAVIVAVSEIARRDHPGAAALASLPLTSLLAFVWLYLETGDTQRIGALSIGIFWLVLASLPLFLLLPWLLRAGWTFWTSLAAACLATAGIYLAMVWFLDRINIRI
jgi:hypothetical protein